MMRGLLAALMITGLLVGCSEAELAGDEPEPAGGESAAASESEAPQPDPELVAWLDEFCGAYWDASVSWPADLPVPRPPTEADRRPLIDALEELIEEVAAIDEAAAALEPAPNDSAADLLERYRESYEGLRTRFTEDAELASVVPVENLETLYELNALTLAGFLPFGTGLDVLAEYGDLKAVSPHTENCPGAGAEATADS